MGALDVSWVFRLAPLSPSQLGRRKILGQALGSIAALATSAIALGPGLAQAQSAGEINFPTKPITLIVPWPPGGSTDRHLRKFAELAAKYVGQTIVVENKPGAGGMLGPSTMAASAKPDGYTLAQLPMSAFRIPHMQPVSWDPIS